MCICCVSIRPWTRSLHQHLLYNPLVLHGFGAHAWCLNLAAGTGIGCFTPGAHLIWDLLFETGYCPSVALDLFSFIPLIFLLWIFVNKLDFDSWDQRGDEEHFLPCMDPISLEHNEINGLFAAFHSMTIVVSCSLCLDVKPALSGPPPLPLTPAPNHVEPVFQQL